MCVCVLFLSTLSLRRATNQCKIDQQRSSISIHALLAESDPKTVTPNISTSLHFYPRSPCGERPVPQQENGQAATISIHALLAESDSTVDSCSVCSSISIHALLAESDRSSVKWQFIRYIFLSTLSLRRATKRYFIYFIGRLLFLSTLSLRRATQK